MIAMNERLHQKGGKLDGWVEKSGRFSLTTSSTVLRRFSHSTRLHARVERENGVTTIRGSVSDGADPRSRSIIYGILVLAGVLLIIAGYFLPGLLVIAYIPLEGNFNNSQALIAEVQRTLKARPTLPPALRKAEAKKAAKGDKRSVSSGSRSYR
jgi:hypothetical protein